MLTPESAWDAATEAARAVAAFYRAELARIAHKYGRPEDPSALVPYISQAISQLEPAAARTLRDAQLAAWFGGADHTAGLLPDSFRQLASFDLGTGRAFDSGFSFGPSLYHFPQLDRARQYIRNRIPFEPAEYEQLDAEAKRVALTVAGATTLETVEKVQSLLAEDVETGGTLAEFRQLVTEQVADAIPAHSIETLYRSQVGRAYSAGQIAVLDSPYVRDEFPYLIWSATHDSRVRPDHLAMETAGLNGTAVYRGDDPIWDTLYPPADYNCVLPGTRVAGRFLAGVRSFYRGQAVEVVTKLGSVIRVTVNHPILTEQGWINAGSIKKGDQLFRHERQGKIGFGFPFSLPLGFGRRATKEYDQPTPIEKVFCAIESVGFAEHGRAKASDFHGDGVFLEGDVDVVRTDHRLHFNRKSIRLNQGSHFGFEFPRTTDVCGSYLKGLFVSGHGSPLKSFGVGSTANFDAAFLKVSRQGASLYAGANRDGLKRLTSHVSGNQGIGVVLSSSRMSFYSVSGDAPINPLGRAAEFLSDLRGAHPRLVRGDEVVNVRRIEYAGHVYDLQSVTGLLLTESIVLGNCRCVVFPLSVEDAAAYGVREAIEWLRTGQPPAQPEFVPRPPLVQSPSWTPTGRRLSPVGA